MSWPWLPLGEMIPDFIRPAHYLQQNRIRGVSRKQVNLQVLDQNIYTGDATGRLLFNMLGAITQFEKEIRAERQLDGIQKAKGAACTSAGKRN